MNSGNSQSNLVKSSSSLAIVYNPSGDYSLVAGNTFALRVTITNQGVRSALINIYIDETSLPVWEWFEQPFQQVALAVGESSEIIFTLNVPLTAIPDDYEYLVIIDAPQHYPQETPITQKSILKVLSPVEDATPVQDPTFVVSPESNAEEPLIVASGQTIDVEALVFNNTQRVDRFRLRCLDLPPSWYQIIYPEGVEELGLVVATKNLALNPGTKGRIILRLTIPANLNADNYSASLQLYSDNNPDLVLLNLFYFQIAPIYKVNFQLNAIVKQVSTEAGIYEILIQNLGNTRREIIAQGKTYRGTKLCEFNIEPQTLTLEPNRTEASELQIKPKRWWRRPIFGQGMPIDFQVEFVDGYQLPLPRAVLKGQLIWEARPWWHLVLFALTGVGIIATIVFLIWWFFFKPPAPPKILDFASDSPTYRAINNDFIHLNWQVENGEQIASISIKGRNPSGQVISTAQRYNFRDGIPEELEPYCNLDGVLICRNIRTDASRPGEYIYEIEVNPKLSGQATVSQATNLINILPLPKPQIINILAQLQKFQLTDRNGNPQNPLPNQQTNNSANSNSLTEQRNIFLSFTIDNWQQLDTLQILGKNAEQVVKFAPVTYNFTPTVPKELQNFCNNNLNPQQLTCFNLPLKVNQAGQYTFEVAISSKESERAIVDRQQSAKIAIQPLPKPQIVAFNSNQTNYIENQEILLNWQVVNSRNLGQIEIIGRSREGVVNVPAVTYNFAQGVPSELEPYCQLNDTLTCQFVPTGAIQAGDYQFELNTIARNNPLEKKSAKSELLIVKALPKPVIPEITYPLEINSFTINGINAPAKYVVNINPELPVPSLNIAWQVEASPEATINLQPSPGKVESTGQISYPLTPKSGQERLTLTVTDEKGKRATRSVIIEKVVIQPPKPEIEQTPQGNQQNNNNNQNNGTNQNNNNQNNNVPSIPSETIPPFDPTIPSEDEQSQPPVILPSDLPPKL